MTHQQVSLALATGLGLALAASVSAQARTPPAPHCMNAVGVQEVEQASPRSIALRAASGQPFRIDFNEDCPGVRSATSLKLEAANAPSAQSPRCRIATMPASPATASACAPLPCLP